MRSKYAGPIALITSIVILATIAEDAANLLPLLVYNGILCARHATAPASGATCCYILLMGATLMAAITTVRDKPTVVVAITMSALATVELQGISGP
jgi:hypothetical protein